MHSLNTLKAIISIALEALLAGCVPQLVDFTVSNFGYTLHRDIAYGEGPRHKLDIYIPKQLNDPAPVLLFIHGGNWQYGSKELYKGVGQSLATEGVVVVIADYRLYPGVLYPEFLHDAAAAFRFVQANVETYGGDPERIFVSGHSAGAYNAVMLASDPSYLTAQGLGLPAISGVIGIAGPYNFLPLTDDNLIDMFGGADRIETQPTYSVDGERPPMLLVTGSEDDTVLPKNVSTMAARLREFNSPVETITYDGEGHLGIILSLYWPFQNRNSLREDILQFVRTK